MVNSSKYIHYLYTGHCLELFQTMFLKLFVSISRDKGGKNVPTRLDLLERASLNTADSEAFEKARNNGPCPKHWSCLFTVFFSSRRTFSRIFLRLVH
jgi:hypothetical protein